MRNIDKYTVFQKSHELVLKIYEITKRFPKEELYGLSLQMRRAAYSIPMNLKEGGGGSEKEFLKYVRIAYGSCEELSYQILLSRDLGYITGEEYKEISEQNEEIRKMLFSMMDKLKNG